MNNLSNDSIRNCIDKPLENWLSRGEIMDALRELLAFREAAEKPVATVDIQSGRPDGRKFALVYSSAMHSLPDDVYHLFAAPPLAVVPDERDWLFYCEKYPEMPMGDAIIRAVEWNACRAAMLNGGNSPVTPDGWIPVIERLPEGGITVILASPDLADPVTGWVTDSGLFIWSLEGESQIIKVSHWMPIPAAPKPQ